MLINLRIENFAIIERLSCISKPGWRSSPGKPARVIDNPGCHRRAHRRKSRSQLLRSGTERAIVKASFYIPPALQAQVTSLLAV